MDPLNRTIPLKKRQEPRRREGINRRENRIGKPGGGPQAKEDHCREIGKSWQIETKDQGSNIHSVEEGPWSATTFKMPGMWTGTKKMFC